MAKETSVLLAIKSFAEKMYQHPTLNLEVCVTVLSQNQLIPVWTVFVSPCLKDCTPKLLGIPRKRTPPKPACAPVHAYQLLL